MQFYENVTDDRRKELKEKMNQIRRENHLRCDNVHDLNKS